MVLDGRARGVIGVAGASVLDEKGLQPTSAMSDMSKMQALDHASNRIRFIVSLPGVSRATTRIAPTIQLPGLYTGFLLLAYITLII